MAGGTYGMDMWFGNITISSDTCSTQNWAYIGGGGGGAGQIKNKMTKKYYRVKKDLPAWKAGAVIESGAGQSSNGYRSVNDLYDADCVEGQDYIECGYVVENSPEWFERVYPVSLLSKTVYRLKEEARELFAKEHQA